MGEKLWKASEAAEYLQLAVSTVWKKAQLYRASGGKEGWEHKIIGKRGLRFPDHVIREAARKAGVKL